MLGEYDANGVPIYETIYLGMTANSKVGSDPLASPVVVLKQTGTVAGSNIATSLYNVYSDHLATPRVITRPSDEAIVWRWDAAEAFGATAPNQNPNALGAFVFNQRLPGQVFDAETGLFQNWNREYNARLGRYIQSDPIGLNGGINTYAYVGGNPLSHVDARGLDNPNQGPYYQTTQSHADCVKQCTWAKEYCEDVYAGSCGLLGALAGGFGSKAAAAGGGLAGWIATANSTVVKGCGVGYQNCLMKCGAPPPSPKPSPEPTPTPDPDGHR
jgi:RHS repeat-associated protein